MSEGYEYQTCKYEQDIVTNVYARDKHERRKCPRPVYGGTGYCIFHAPIEAKRDSNFGLEIKYLYEKALEEYKYSPGTRDGTVFFDCQGFKFPEGAFNRLPREIEIPVVIGDAEIEGDVDFKNVEFWEPVIFNGVVFKGRMDFENAHFHGYLVFQQCRFSVLDGPSCWFFNSVFGADAIFRMCNCEGETDFLGSHFLGRASFSIIEIKKSLNLNLCEFAEEAVFHRICAEFEDYGYLDGFVPVINPRAIVDFRNVRCLKPGILTFQELNLSNWAFSQTPGIVEASFIKVSWYPPGKGRSRTRDEALLAIGEVSYEDCAETYALLKKNYERKTAIGIASDFYIGEKLMALKNPKTPFAKKVFLWLYYCTSNFGESAVKPLYVLCILSVVFTTIWLLKGFQFDPVTNINYDIAWFGTLDLNVKEFARDLIKSALYTIKIFITPPTLKFDTLTEILAGIQRLAGLSLIVYLFLPAFKRIFRR